MKKFCIIAVDYENHVPRGGQIPSIESGLQSIANQTFKNFNLIICHDGPKERKYLDEGVDFKSIGVKPILLNTNEKAGDWGHSSRDFAMRHAYNRGLGEYYIQFNIDNFLRENALEKINDAISSVDKKVFIFSIIHHKMGGQILTGIPPVHCNIDALQLVAHKDVWKDIGFWYNKENTSDGMLYQEICTKYEYEHVPDVLGENF